ncbi:MAG: hypothetical protein SFW67_22080 [Myxococcaceae bacterium]|nr:hypothetical protein [Myxococcaceae bacterium]
MRSAFLLVAALWGCSPLMPLQRDAGGEPDASVGGGSATGGGGAAGGGAAGGGAAGGGAAGGGAAGGGTAGGFMAGGGDPTGGGAAGGLTAGDGGATADGGIDAGEPPFDGGIGPTPPGGLVGGEPSSLRIGRVRRLTEEFLGSAVASQHFFMLVQDGGTVALRGPTGLVDMPGAPNRTFALKGSGSFLAASISPVQAPFTVIVTLLEVNADGTPRRLWTRTEPDFGSSNGALAVSAEGAVFYAGQSLDGGLRVVAFQRDGGSTLTPVSCGATVFGAELTELGLVLLGYSAGLVPCLGPLTQSGRVLLLPPDGGPSRLTLSGFGPGGQMGSTARGVFVVAPLDDGGIGTADVFATELLGFTTGTITRGSISPQTRVTGIAGAGVINGSLWVLDSFIERPGRYDAVNEPGYSGSARPASSRVSVLSTGAQLTFIDSLSLARGQVSVDGFWLTPLPDAGAVATVLVSGCEPGSPSIFCRPDGGEGTWMVELAR